MARLRFGFVGAGEIAVASAEAIAETTNASTAVVFDVRPELAADLAARSGARVAASLDELLSATDVDAVYICVPHFLHRDAAERATSAGKHVFIEKPMGVSVGDALAIADACRSRGLACGVPFVAREAPAYRAARVIVSSGSIGDVTGFTITFLADKPPSYWAAGWSGRVQDDWRTSWSTAGGGVLLMNAIHDIDAILSITGLEVERVATAITTPSGGPVEVEDTAVGILTCTGGALGGVEARAAVPGSSGPAARWVNRIYGTRGQLLLPSPWSDDGYALYTRTSAGWSEIEPEPSASARARAFEGFAAAVLAGSPPPVGAADGVRASRIVHAMYEAARRGDVVDVGGPAGRTG